MKKIGFIGVGIMGKSMIRNLMKAGFEIRIYSRTKEKALDLIAEGAIWCDTIKDCVFGCEAVITIVGYPEDVEQVYFGEQGILHNLPAGTYVIDMTTTSPKLAIRIHEQAKAKGIIALDAPVTGGDVGAKAGTLTILAGGEEQAFEHCLPLFQAMGQNITWQGKAGNGQHTKMCNQIAIAGALAGVCEALAYAKGVGLDSSLMIKSISTGAAGSAQMTNVAPRILAEDFSPGFFMKHFIKDMMLADEQAKGADVHLGTMEYVLSMYQKLAGEGLGDLGTQALIQYYE